MKFNAIRFLEDARPEHDVFVTWGVAVGFVRLVLFRNPFVDISAGADVTCGVRLLGDLSCWGSNERSMLASAACSYGISAFCWGKNDLGQLGVRTSTTTLSTSPIAVAPPAGFPTPLAFRSISAGGGITCGIITERFDRNRRLLLPVE